MREDWEGGVRCNSYPLYHDRQERLAMTRDVAVELPLLERDKRVMPNYSPNPRASEIKSRAVLAYKAAGIDVGGQQHFWIETPADPGKAVFWRDGLVSCGVELKTALGLVADLEAIKPSW